MPTERTLYVVVHGVGDPAPGETVRELARGFTSTGRPVVLTEERAWLAEPDPEADPAAPGPRLARTFPVAVLHDDANGRILAEVNWADLSRFPVSLFGLFEGVFSLLFGLRHVAYEAAAPGAYPGADVLRRLGRVTVLSLIGPLVATNLLMLFLLFAAAVADWQTPASFAGPAGEKYAAAGCVAAAAFGLFLRWWRDRSEVYRLVGGWLAVVSAVVLAGAAALLAAGGGAEFWRYANLAPLHDALTKTDPNSPPTGGVVFYAAVAIVPLALAFLTANAAALAAAVVFFTRFWFHRNAETRNAALAATVLPFVMLFGWCVLIPVIWSVGGKVVRSRSELGVSAMFQGVFQTLLDFILSDLPLWFFVLVTLGVAAALGGIAWLRKREVEDGEKRLIVGSWLLWTLAAGCLLAPAVVFIRLTPYSDVIPQPEKETKVVLGLLLAGLPLLPLVLKMLFPSLRSGLDLVYDVVTHFRPRFPKPDGQPDYYIRRAIRARLEMVVASSAARLFAGADRSPCHLVIVSHSQGTMVALGALNDPALGPALGRFESVRFVTMGSPFAHIYQHYFRHHYPALSAPDWETLREVLKPKDGRPRWVNLYRVDDYVGRRIDDAGTGLVENQRVGVHGHTNYWSDTEIIGELVRLGIVRGGAP